MADLSRRRFIAITASAALVGPSTGLASVGPPRAAWKGTALGARAAIWFDGVSPRHSARLVIAVRREIDRLEDLFSLYRADSALSRLNTTGRLTRPDPDFLAILTLARSVHAATGGAFDPTVQPTWAALAEHHADSRNGADASMANPGPALGNFTDLRFDTKIIAFARPSMALTLNGIAQGFITDKIADLLRRAGLTNVLVHAGEYRALGGLERDRGDAAGWPVTIAADAGLRRAGTIAYLDNMALATSDPVGTTFDSQGRVSHIIDPRTGNPTQSRASITVTSPLAAIADGLSTGFCLMRQSQIKQALAHYSGTALV